MNHRHLLSIVALAGTVLATSGCVATAGDGYYGDSGGYGYGYSRPGDTVYIQGSGYDDRYYRDRDRERDRQAWERQRDREREARERERDRQARDRDRERDQRARDEDRRREMERQARDRDRQNRDRDRNNYNNNNNRGGYTGPAYGNSHAAECQRIRNQNAAGSDTVNTPSRPC